MLYTTLRFRSALVHARHHLSARRTSGRDVTHERRDRLVIKSSGRIYFLRTADIDWCEAAGNYVRLQGDLRYRRRGFDRRVRHEHQAERSTGSPYQTSVLSDRAVALVDAGFLVSWRLFNRSQAAFVGAESSLSGRGADRDAGEHGIGSTVGAHTPGRLSDSLIKPRPPGVIA
jgi:hypothetical protein